MSNLTYRVGGPKEHRLKKNGELILQAQNFYTVRITHLPKNMSYVVILFSFHCNEILYE